MTRRYGVVVGIVVAVLAAVVWAAAGGVSGAGGNEVRRGAARWEYGIFSGEGVWTWYALDTAVDNADAGEFAGRMHARYAQRGTELEANVLNSLAAQGWELVAAPEKNKYVLRRPR